MSIDYDKIKKGRISLNEFKDTGNYWTTIDRVIRGKRVVLTSGGKQVIALIPIDDYRTLEKLNSEEPVDILLEQKAKAAFELWLTGRIHSLGSTWETADEDIREHWRNIVRKTWEIEANFNVERGDE